MSLPDTSKLKSLAKKTTAEKEQLGLPTSGWFWSSSEGSADFAYPVDFYNGYARSYFKGNSNHRVLCVGD